MATVKDSEGYTTMPGNTAYKGFRYQKKCAFLYVLRELAQASGVRHFRMEHAHGDDFDLLYDTLWKVHQVKDTAVPATGKCLKKMWCKYSEDVRPHAPREIELHLVFSKDHASDSGIRAIRGRDHANRALTGVFSRLRKDTKVRARPSATDWSDFLTMLQVAVIEVPAVEGEITERCRQRFAYFKPSEEQLNNLIKSFLDELDQIMAEGRQVPIREIEEVLDRWCDDNLLQLPGVRKKMADLHLRRANELWPGVTGTPISGSGTL